MSAVRRLRAGSADLALLSILALVAAVLVTGVPRYTDHLATQALRADIARAPAGMRDVVFTERPDRLPESLPAARLDVLQKALPAPLPGAVGQRWFAATVPPEGGSTLVPSGPRTLLGLCSQTGLADAATLVDGRWPANGPSGDTVQIALSSQIAGMFGMRVGDGLRLGGSAPAGLTVRVVGIYRPHDGMDPFWTDIPIAARVPWPLPDQPFQAIAMTDPAGVLRAARVMPALFFTWRYRFAEERLAPQPVESLAVAAAAVPRLRVAPSVSVSSGLALLLDEYQRRLQASRALLAVVAAGLLVPLLAATVLAARLAAERRRQEYALLRARGAATATVGARVLAETAVTVPVALLLGWWLAGLVPGRASAGVWPLAVVAAVTVLAGPVLAMLAVRPAAPKDTRRDLSRSRPSAARLTAELSVPAAAVIGLLLVRRRGLDPQQGVDAYLSAVPVLLAAGASLLALRLLPVPVRLVADLAGRGRGLIAFLSLSRVARSAAVHGAPLAVLVVAVTTGLFAGAVATSIDDARDRVADRDVGADVQLRGERFAADTAERLAAVPGVTAVAPMAMQFDARAYPPGRAAQPGSVPALVVDGPRYQRVLRAGDIPAELPGVLLRARRAGGPVPAVVSPAVAADLGGPGTRAVVLLRGRPYDITVAEVADAIPGLGAGTDRFVVLPWQAMPADAVVVVNRLAVAGDRADTAALRAAGDEGQHASVRAQAGREPDGLDSPTELVTWEQSRRALDRTGANSLLSFTFSIGLLGGAALALLAVGLAVLIGARPRGQVLSRLRTMGLDARAGRRLLLVELAPMVGLAVLLGAVLGTVLPALLRPALDLTEFTAGVAPVTRVHPLLLAGLPVLMVLALAVAVLVESVVNRRMRLGEALRISEER